MKKFISIIVTLCAVVTIVFTDMSLTVFATETLGGTFIDVEDVGENVAKDNELNGYEDTRVQGTEPPVQTSISEVTDEEGNVVTDEEGNPVTTVIEIEGSTESTETTVPNHEMEGQFETARSLSDEEMQDIIRIRRELEDKKKGRFGDVFGLITAVVGIIIIVYTLVLAIAWLVDRLGLSGEVEVMRLLTLNNAITLRDEADKDVLKQSNSKITIMDKKRIIMYTILGCGLGTLLTQSTHLLALIQYVYAWIMER